MERVSSLVKFGEWLPDKGSLNAGGATVIKNAVPVGEDYTAIESLAAQSDALPSECLGMFGGIDGGGTPFLFAGTATKLYKLNGSAWTDVTRASGGDYATSGENMWRFAQYGSYVFATNYNDAMQSFDLTSSTDFANAVGSAPKAKWLANINNFLVAVNIDDSGAFPFRVQWSGLDDPTTWVTSSLTQSDAQDVFDGGNAVALVGSQNSGVLLMERAIWRMDYVGTPTIFNFTLAEPNRGCSVAGSVATFSGLVFFYGEDGFSMYNGTTSVPIGYEKIDNWFRENVDYNNIYKMQASVNPRRKQVIWSFPRAGGAGVNDTMLIYNWASQRWAYAEQGGIFNGIFSSAVLADNVAVYSDSIEELADGPSYSGGRSLLGCISGNRLCYFTGEPMTAELETQEVRLSPSTRSLVWGVSPVVDGTAQVELKSRDTQTAVYDVTGLQDVDVTTQEAFFNVDARYHRARIVITGGFERAQGVQIGFRETGKV